MWNFGSLSDVKGKTHVLCVQKSYRTVENAMQMMNFHSYIIFEDRINVHTQLNVDKSLSMTKNPWWEIGIGL